MNAIWSATSVDGCSRTRNHDIGDSVEKHVRMDSENCHGRDDGGTFSGSSQSHAHNQCTTSRRCDVVCMPMFI